ncbi:hypothetical protein RJ640_002044, partial [Escallonia rubra]
AVILIHVLNILLTSRIYSRDVSITDKLVDKFKVEDFLRTSHKPIFCIECSFVSVPQCRAVYQSSTIKTVVMVSSLSAIPSLTVLVMIFLYVLIRRRESKKNPTKNDMQPIVQQKKSLTMKLLKQLTVRGKTI